MSFISTVAANEAKDDVKTMYEQFENYFGYVPNFARLFSHRPEVQVAWRGLIRSVVSNLDRRRFELATVAAARGLQNSYCMMAHSKELLNLGVQPQQLKSIAVDHTKADLDPVDVAIMSYAEKVARDASAVKAEDIQELRDHGLTDTEIFDVAAAVAARCFFATLLDALGALPDSVYLELGEDLVSSLLVGREISTDEVEHL